MAVITFDQSLKANYPPANSFYLYTKEVEDFTKQHAPNPHNAILLLPKSGYCKFIYAKDLDDNKFVCALPAEVAPYHANIAKWLELRLLKRLEVQGGGYLNVSEGGVLELSGSSQKYGSANYAAVLTTLKAALPVLPVKSSVENLDFGLLESTTKSEFENIPVMTYCPQTKPYDQIIVKSDWLAKLINRIDSFYGGSFMVKDDLIQLAEYESMLRMKHLQEMSGKELLEVVDRQTLKIQRKIEKWEGIQCRSSTEDLSLIEEVGVRVARVFDENINSYVSKLDNRCGAWYSVSVAARENPQASFRFLVARHIVDLKEEIRLEAGNYLEELRDRIFGRA